MIIQQLEQGKDFTHQEMAVVTFILSNPEMVLEKAAKEIATLTFTSPATINRLCKKLGFKGYHEFQLQYVKEHATQKNETSAELDRNASNMEITETVESLYKETVLKTKQMVKKESLNRIINVMIHAKRIDFYANDMNFIRAQGFCLRLNSLGINSQVFNTYNEFYVKTLGENDSLSFLISHTGKNPTIVKTANELRRRNITTIALTSSIERELELLCDESLYIYSGSEELTSLQYGVSLDYLLDILYVCLVARIKK